MQTITKATFLSASLINAFFPLSVWFKNHIYQFWQDHKTCKIKDTEPDINCSRMDALEVSNSSMFCFFASTNKISIVDWRIYQQFNVCLHIQLWTVQRNNIYLHIQDKFGAQHSLINDVRSLFFFRQEAVGRYLIVISFDFMIKFNLVSLFHNWITTERHYIRDLEF